MPVASISFSWDNTQWRLRRIRAVPPLGVKLLEAKATCEVVVRDPELITQRQIRHPLRIALAAQGLRASF